ncbi:MAG: ammonium transporter [Oscillospiraceae bacterium]|jgi:Amt family ammonium transporter|nr:ammonium transporter [Oscillospiraceae bacterium]
MESSIQSAIAAAANEGWSIWFLIGAALVFFMQCGFAMVETGFTRAKNAGNIVMKNLIDFCIGTVVFVPLGFALMMSENYLFGVIGVPNLQIFTNFSDFPFSVFVFNLVFAATAATIVSGAMAERTKFSAYCIYSAVISAVIYPIEAGWLWNAKGWLAQLGYLDFAGSSAIHMVGGIASIVGAIFLGPRIGKYAIDKKTGKNKSRAIPGHSLTLGALGVFILWFGWYGFNGAAAVSVEQLGSIFLTTTIAPAVATVVTMCFTWIRSGKPDVSMSLNGSLAGLVAVTAGCTYVDATGSVVIGLVAGILVVVAVELIDKKLHVDDPVGAIAVHGANGLWGTIAVGFFATDGGLFYGGGFKQLGVQLLGVLAIGAWTAVTMTITFFFIKKFHGLRADPEDELRGLDISEHGLASSYADFLIAPEAIEPSAVVIGETPAAQAIPVVHKTKPELLDGYKFTKVDIICTPSKLESLKVAMNGIGITGMTVTNVMGFGMQGGGSAQYRGVEVEVTFLPKVKLEIIVCKVPVETVIDTAKKVLYTGKVGDGKIFIYDVENVVKVRTGEEGYDALQDEI